MEDRKIIYLTDSEALSIARGFFPWMNDDALFATVWQVTGFPVFFQSDDHAVELAQQLERHLCNILAGGDTFGCCGAFSAIDDASIMCPPCDLAMKEAIRQGDLKWQEDTAVKEKP